jgi:hypothetical protein
MWLLTMEAFMHRPTSLSRHSLTLFGVPLPWALVGRLLIAGAVMTFILLGIMAMGGNGHG